MAHKIPERRNQQKTVHVLLTVIFEVQLFGLATSLILMLTDVHNKHKKRTRIRQFKFDAENACSTGFTTRHFNQGRCPR